MSDLRIEKPSSLPYFELDNIVLEQRIGRGNFSVFKATMGATVMAVKKMDCDKNNIPHEVTVQRKIPSHPNVLQLLGITHSRDGFTLYICMELADTSLHHYLHTDKKKPSLQQSTQWAMQIARGMQHIHQHGVAHRDLKSANVLLFEKEGAVKICDFGCARPLEKTATMTGMTGTFRWMAPEFDSTADAKVNKRCDVFSYAMVLFEIFAHELPFAELDESVVQTRIRDEERPSIPPELPSYLQNLMQSCWKHKPHVRPTFEQILQALDLRRPLDLGPELLKAAASGDSSAVQQLIEDGVDVDSQNEDGETALHLAAARGHSDVIRKLIMAQVDLNLQDKYGWTALIAASLKDHVSIVQLLLDAYADVSICEKGGISPLYAASGVGNTEMVDILLKAGGDPNLATTTYPCSVPLGIVAKLGHLETLKRLLRERVNINYQDKDGASPLYQASFKGHADVVDVLLRNGADPNLALTTHPYSVPLGISATNGHAKVVEMLLNAGANINYQNQAGATPLISAFLNGHMEVARLLLQRNADISIHTTSGKTAMDIAVAKGHREMVDLLKQYGRTY